MRIADASFAVLRLQYRIVRIPLALIEVNVVARMGPEAPVRLFYERSFGLLDATVGKALGDLRLGQHGAALAERSEVLGRAAELDAAARQARQMSAESLEAKSDKAFEEQRDAWADAEREIAEAKSAAEDQKRAVDAAAAQRSKPNDAESMHAQPSVDRAQADRVEDLGAEEKQRRTADK